MKKILKSPLKALSIIYLLVLILLIIFFFCGGGDFEFHIQRIQCITDDIRSGLNPRIYSTALNGYGYGSPMFYGDLFLYPFAFLNFLGINLLISYKIMLICVVIGVYLSISYVSKELFKTEKAQDTLVLMYLLLSSIYSNTIVSNCVGRSFATIFIPIVFLGGIEILKENKINITSIFTLSISMSCVILCQTIDAMIVFICLLILIAFDFKKITINKMTSFILSGMICILLTAFFIFPMLEQMSYQKFWISSSIASKGRDLSNYTIPLAGWFLPSRLYRLIGEHFMIENMQDRNYGFGYLGMLIVNVIYLLNYKSNKNDKSYLPFVFISLFVIVFQTKLFPHKLINNFVGVLQFPWRLVIVGGFASAIVVGKLVENNENLSNKHLKLIVVSSTLLALINIGVRSGIDFSYLVINGTDRRVGYDYSVDYYSIGNGEYLPEKIYNKFQSVDYKEYLNGEYSNNITGISKDKSGIVIRTELNDGTQNVTLPVLYYKGYSAKSLYFSENILLVNGDGYVRLICNNQKDVIKLIYKGTFVQKVSDYISISTLVLMLINFLIRRKGTNDCIIYLK